MIRILMQLPRRSLVLIPVVIDCYTVTAWWQWDCQWETWPPIGWNHAFVIGWSKDKLGLPSAPLHYGLTWPVGIPTVFQTPVTVPLHCPSARLQEFWNSSICLLYEIKRKNLFKSTCPTGSFTCPGRWAVGNGEPWTHWQPEVFPWEVYPHSLIKPRKCQHTIIETVLLARNCKIQQNNETQSQFCTLHNHGPTHW